MFYLLESRIQYSIRKILLKHIIMKMRRERINTEGAHPLPASSPFRLFLLFHNNHMLKITKMRVGLWGASVLSTYLNLLVIRGCEIGNTILLKLKWFCVGIFLKQHFSYIGLKIYIALTFILSHHHIATQPSFLPRISLGRAQQHLV